MKKCLLPLFAALCLVCWCCTSSTSKPEASKAPHEKRMKSFIDGFLSENPECFNNDVARKEAAQRLAADFTKAVQADSLALISELPATFEMMLPYPGDSLFVVKFVCLGMDSDVSEEYDVAYQTLSIVQKEKAVTLVEKKQYVLAGSFVGFLDYGNFTLPSGGGAQDLPTINKFTMEKPSFNLGTLIIENLTFVPVN